MHSASRRASFAVVMVCQGQVATRRRRKMSSCVLSYYKDHDGAEVNAREPPVPTEAARMHVKQYPSAKRSPLIQKINPLSHAGGHSTQPLCPPRRPRGHCGTSHRARVGTCRPLLVPTPGAGKTAAFVHPMRCHCWPITLPKKTHKMALAKLF